MFKVTRPQPAQAGAMSSVQPLSGGAVRAMHRLMILHINSLDQLTCLSSGVHMHAVLGAMHTGAEGWVLQHQHENLLPSANILQI
jgi:hypothetical protein